MGTVNGAATIDHDNQFKKNSSTPTQKRTTSVGQAALKLLFDFWEFLPVSTRR
jgi:hypothetical protein